MDYVNISQSELSIVNIHREYWQFWFLIGWRVHYVCLLSVTWPTLANDSAAFFWWWYNNVLYGNLYLRVLIVISSTIC